MGEVIQIHIGQAGIQIGEVCWQIFCQDHYITKDGELNEEGITAKGATNTNFFFEQLSSGKFISRCIFVDLDRDAIDEVKRSSMYKNLFKTQNYIAGKQSCAHNYSMGHYTIGKEIIEETLDKIRKIYENCSNLQGFLIYHSLSGGTGGGFTCMLLSRLNIDYPKIPKVTISLYPSQKYSNSTVEPINFMLVHTHLVELSTLTINFNNQGLYNICRNYLDLEQANYNDINQIIAMQLSSITSSMRFNENKVMNISLDDLHHNLVPYHRMHTLINSFSPFQQRQQICSKIFDIESITNDLFSNRNLTTSINLEDGEFLACAAMFKGLGISTNEVIQSINQVKNQQHINFVDWSPTGFKVGINLEQNLQYENSHIRSPFQSGSMLANHSSISSLLKVIANKFDKLYHKRAFLHWFVGEGLESDELVCCRDDLDILLKDYTDTKSKSAE